MSDKEARSITDHHMLGGKLELKIEERLVGKEVIWEEAPESIYHSSSTGGFKLMVSNP